MSLRKLTCIVYMILFCTIPNKLMACEDKLTKIGVFKKNNLDLS